MHCLYQAITIGIDHVLVDTLASRFDCKRVCASHLILLWQTIRGALLHRGFTLQVIRSVVS